MHAGERHMRNWNRFYRKHSQNTWYLLLGGGLLACLLAIGLSLSLGSVNFPPGQLWRLFGSGGTESPIDTVSRSIFWYARVPRTLACMLAGAGLSVSGAVLQNVLANKLASPSVIGVNAGAGLGVTLCCAAGILSGWAVSAAAFAGSLLVVFCISVFARHTGASKTTVILTGVALNSILSAVRESVTVFVPTAAVQSAEFRIGGFSSVSYTRLVPAGILIVLGMMLLFTLCNELDVVSLGDETAQGIGLPVRAYRLVFLFLAALLSGAAVSFAGLLGFVGLIVPHAVRSITGNESRKLLPLCVLFGGAFVTFCDLAARLFFLPYELPVGILMAIIGGPVFVFLLFRRKGGHRYDGT